MSSAYKREWDSAVEAKYNEMVEVLNMALYGEKSAIRQGAKEKLMPMLDWLYVRDQVGPDDEYVGEFVQKLLRDKSSQAYAKKVQGKSHLDSLHLPNRYSFRFDVVQKGHEVTRRELGYEGKVQTTDQKFSVVAQMASPSGSVDLIQKMDNDASNMERKQVAESVRIGERRMWEIKIGVGVAGPNVVYMCCDCNNKKIKAYIGINYDSLGSAGMTPTAIIGDIQENVSKMVASGPSPEYSIEFIKVDTGKLK